MFTDVVLTGSMNGRDVAMHAHSVRPKTPVLFTSGYARAAITNIARLEEGVALLPKPFTYANLAAGVRKAIDQATAGQN